MCGGNIQAEKGAAFGTCDSCGVTSTLPKASDEKLVNLFNRANHFRRQNEFDKALYTYENILNEDNTNAEAHWCLVLCRYGIEYVEDPRTHERVPTCHRAQYASILTDVDYLAALENAPDSYARELYETEAKKINEILKGIIAISNSENTFDIFICYKETDEGGNRTKDSVLAQDIYFQLVNDGYRVFFSKITLEEKLGQEYEPYIFAALNSAKVMLVIGTKKEYFEAVWVRNEWSRFLSLMKGDRSRLLIPCYRDMDAYDMPDEFSHLQAQDMSKIGFIQDLIRGIKKIQTVKKTYPVKPAPQADSSADVIAGVGADTLLKRAYIFLEDADFTQAREYFNRVLDADAENARAYVGLLCVEMKMRHERDLANADSLLNESVNYKNALRFADEGLRVTLQEYEQTNNEKIENIEKERQEIEQHAQDELKKGKAKLGRLRKWTTLRLVGILLLPASILFQINAEEITKNNVHGKPFLVREGIICMLMILTGVILFIVSLIKSHKPKKEIISLYGSVSALKIQIRNNFRIDEDMAKDMAKLKASNTWRILCIVGVLLLLGALILVR